jgi:hypothetical protein
MLGPCCRLRGTDLFFRGTRTEEVTDGVEDAGEAEAGVDVALDDVEGEVVKAAEGPNAEDEEDEALEGGDADPEEAAGNEADRGEEGRLDLHRAMAVQITHGAGKGKW